MGRLGLQVQMNDCSPVDVTELVRCPIEQYGACQCGSTGTASDFSNRSDLRTSQASLSVETRAQVVEADTTEIRSKGDHDACGDACITRA